MNVKWDRFNEFATVATVSIATRSPETKTVYALEKVMKAYRKHSERLQSLITNIQIDHCLTEKTAKGEEAILKDERGNLRYSPEGQKKCNKAIEELVEDFEVELDPFTLSEVPIGLTLAEIEAFAGFILDEAKAQAKIEEILDNPKGEGPASEDAQSHKQLQTKGRKR